MEDTDTIGVASLLTAAFLLAIGCWMLYEMDVMLFTVSVVAFLLATSCLVMYEQDRRQ